MSHKGVCAAVLLQVLAHGPAFSQAVTGSISGSVADASGSAVTAAQLVLVNAATGAQRTTQTNNSGEFVISSVDPGEYSLTVQAPGFKTLQRTGIRLTPSEILAIGTLSLALGTVEERVTVTAEGTAVQTASAERAGAITSSQTEELPVYGRTVTSLVAIEPGVVDPIGAPARTLAGGSTTDFNVLGNRTSMNNFTVDGITMTATGGSPNATFGVSMEAVSEMKVLLSNYQAEYGRLSGSNVEIVTKSGTRDYHGMGMYYIRNEDLNANNSNRRNKSPGSGVHICVPHNGARF
ncbi:MAG TPA: carboxypeptidase-like regulatory domain-containing protein [Bryobacteraceae bacterium]|nr:carboxypeptidase-like regulatory domain-containing protein [Bryobacteraceae bacterium]